jgi:hypothetical protein
MNIQEAGFRNAVANETSERLLLETCFPRR